MVRKVKGGWKVFSEDGKPLSRVYPTREEAEHRLAQIDYFKHRKKK